MAINRRLRRALGLAKSPLRRLLLRALRFDKPSALPMRSLGARPGDTTWEDWRETTQAAMPVRYFLLEELPFWWRVRVAGRADRALYWLQAHTTHRYHLLDMRSREYGYAWGWIDSDQQMLLACFAILKKFVEQEDPRVGLRTAEADFGTTVAQTPALAGRLESEKEIRALYNWWTRERPAQEAALSARWAALASGKDLRQDWPTIGRAEKDALRAEREALHFQADQMLERLLRVRHYMWT